MSDPNRYPATVFWSDEDGGFIAISHDLPGCSACGATRREALDEFDHAVTAWIEAARAVGNPIPTPSPPPAIASYSGKVLLRMPRQLHARLSQAARRENVSLNQYMVFLLSASAQAPTPTPEMSFAASEA